MGVAVGIDWSWVGFSEVFLVVAEVDSGGLGP